MPSLLQQGWRQDIVCDTADEFLQILHPLGGRFRQESVSNLYVFRGVVSQRHELVPSAFRLGSELLLGDQFTSPPLRYSVDQCAAELATLRRFFDIAARHGIRVPEDSQALRQQLDDWEWKLRYAGDRDFTKFVWPPQAFYSLIALAQHYGVPTRALDWTWNPLTAAYFSCRGAKAATDEEVCVWVANYRIREHHSMFRTSGESGGPVVLFSASGADNDNLRAQQGLFMLYAQRVEVYDEEFVVRPYDELFVQTYPPVGDKPTILRVRVSSAEAPRLLALLASAGVTAGSLFPGLWGAAREFDEQKLTATIRLDEVP